MKKEEKESVSKGQMPSITITPELVAPFIIESYRRLWQAMGEARKKYGSRYNERNPLQQCIDKLGRPDVNPEYYYEQYRLITEKKCMLPATLRKAVVVIVEPAVRNCFLDLLRKENATVNRILKR